MSKNTRRFSITDSSVLVVTADASLSSLNGSVAEFSSFMDASPEATSPPSAAIVISGGYSDGDNVADLSPAGVLTANILPSPVSTQGYGAPAAAFFGSLYGVSAETSSAGAVPSLAGVGPSAAAYSSASAVSSLADMSAGAGPSYAAAAALDVSRAAAIIVSVATDSGATAGATGSESDAPSLMVTTGVYYFASIANPAPSDAAALSTDQANSVSFISDLNANGTIASTAYWTWNGSNPAGYTTPAGDYKWQGGTAGTAGGTVLYYFTPSSNWSAAEQASFASGLALWSAVANVQFAQTTNAASAMITFTRDVTPGEAYSEPTSVSGNGTVGGTAIPKINADLVSIDTSVYGWQSLGSFTVAGGYGIETVVHEEGHVIGLGHAGPYNFNATAATQQYDSTDTRLWSIMSYIEPDDTSAKYYSSYPVTGTFWNGEYPTTWMPLDILAAQRIYGAASGGPLSGGQVFGFNSNIASSINAFFNFTINTQPVVTLYDSGTGNTLDLSGFAAASNVNLNPGTYSSADGMVNDIAIAFNTAIDKFVGGAGNDSVSVNNDGDTINGGGGTNTVVLAGTEAQYRLAISATNVITVTDTVTGRNGVDTLTNIQYLKFTDKTISITGLHTITFSEYPLYTINPVYTYTDNTVDVIGEIVGDGAQPASPAVAANTAYTGPIYASFLNPVLHVEFDAGYFDTLGSSTISIFGPGGTILSSAVNSAYGIVHYSFDSSSGISAIEVNNTSYDPSGFSLDTISFTGSLTPVAATSSLAITPLSATRVVGQSGTVAFTFTVTRTGNTATAVSALYSVTGSGANPLTPSEAPGGALASGPVSFAAGQTSQVITVNVLGTANVSNNQTFAVTLQAPSVGTAIVTASAAGTVVVGPPAPSDFNGDGQSDLLLQNNNGAIDISTAAGLSVTNAYSLGNPGPTWHVVGSADFNGDGQPDILLQNDNGAIVDYLMNGAAYKAGYDLANLASSWHVRGTGDFNADGKADILVQNDNGAMVLLETNGTSLIAAPSVGALPSGWEVVGVADFNGDKKPDILVQSTGGALVDYTMNGATIASGAVIANLGAGWSVGGTGDYNGDGKADILLHNDNGSDVVLEMNGAVPTAAVGIGNPGLGYNTTVAGLDLNGDGRPDLVVQSAATSTLIGYTLNNTATITAGAVLGTPGVGWNVTGSNPITFIDGTGGTLSLADTAGPDQFNLTSYQAGIHTITGFDPAKDTLALNSAAFPNYATVQGNEGVYQGGTFIGLSATAAIVIQGVTPSQLSSNNFVLR